MTELASIAGKIAALVATDAVFTETGARIISQDGYPAALGAVLSEVDNTILERTLIVGLDEAEIQLVVAGRRLRGIIAVSPDIEGADAAIGQVLSREEPALIASVGDLLTGLCENAQTVTVRSMPAQSLGSSADVGISAPGLADLWGAEDDTSSATPMERFVAKNAAIMTAMLHIVTDEIVDEAGSIDVLKLIWDEQVPAFQKRHAELRGTSDGPLMICLDESLGGVVGCALASVENEACIFSYDPDDLPGIMKSWVAITR